MKKYETRFIKSCHKYELIDLYHLARIIHNNRYDRLIWAAKQFSDKYNYVSSTGAYKDLLGLLN